MGRGCGWAGVGWGVGAIVCLSHCSLCFAISACMLAAVTEMKQLSPNEATECETLLSGGLSSAGADSQEQEVLVSHLHISEARMPMPEVTF